MELSITQSISYLPSHLTSKAYFPLRHLQIHPSIRRHRSSILHSRITWRSSKLVTRAIYEENQSSTFTTTTTTSSSYGASTTEERESSVEEGPVENKVLNDSPVTEDSPKEDSLVDDPVDGFLDSLNVKFDFEDTYSVLFYGSGAVIALWLASAVVGAIDSIPLIPQLMEVVGLGYSIWFTTRFLLFKENRDELAAKVEELKQQVLGSSND